MTREEQIRQASIEYTFLRGTPMCLGGDAFAELNELNRNYAFEEGAKWADKTMIEKACKCYCDYFCGKSICGMCFHKYDHEQQIKSTFNYTECDDLQFIRKNLLE